MRTRPVIQMSKFAKPSLVCSFIFILSACSNTMNNEGKNIDKSFVVEKSRLAEKTSVNTVENEIPVVDENADNNSFSTLESLEKNNLAQFQSNELRQYFSEEASIAITADKMPIKQYLHYVFGELLEVSYVIDETIDENTQPLTLSLEEKISPRELFDLTSNLLIDRKLSVKFAKNIFYIHPIDKRSREDIVIAFGRDLNEVPETTQQIMQIVQTECGISSNLMRSLSELTSVKINADYQQNILFLTGTNPQIKRALEFIALLDNPSNVGSVIGLVNLTFINVDQFSSEVIELLETEGIPVASKKTDGKNLILIPLQSIGSLAVFATSEKLLNRVKYWSKILDKPSEGSASRFFSYKPQFARASDLGTSIASLLGAKSSVQSSNNLNQGNKSGASTGNAPSSIRASGSQGEDFRMVVDERTNSLMFYTTGEKYQEIVPLLRDLDVLPKQVLLDITIAEVSLQDEFRFGVEWALNNETEVTLSTLGAFGATSIGGLSLFVDGNKGPLRAGANSSSSLVKILSNPTLMVMDGMSASINIGSQISVVGATTTNPLTGESQTTTSEYRDTGVNVSVTPTVNAAGIVLLNINQSISNTVPNSSGASGNPDIFNRSLSTEVVANSGQTIMLAGLISEDSSQNVGGVPAVKKIPLLGKLFSNEGDNSSRTELIMLITPKVMDNLDEWQEIKEKMKQGLQYLTY